MKMKKYAVLLMLSMTALLWSSCSKDINEPVPTGGGEHVDQGNTFVVNLPKNAPITQNDITVKAYGVEISHSDDYTYSTSANAVSVVDKEGRTVYDCYASLDTLNSAHSLEINSLETAYTLLLPVFPNVFDYTSDQILATLKRLLSELPETQRLAVAIDKSIIEKGYLDMDAIETEYQSAVDAIVDRLGLRDNYLNGVGKKSYRSPASNPSLVNGDAIWGMKLVMNSSSWDEAGKTWVCKFTAYNENRFAYTAWVRGFKDGNGNVYYYNSDNYDIYRSSILKPQRVSTFLDTFTTWEGLKNYFGDTYHLIFDDDFEYSTWDKTKKSFTMGFTTSKDVVIVACPADNEMMMYYNVMKVVIDPIIKKIAKKLTNAEDDDYMLNFCIDLIADNNYRLSFSQIINGNKNWGAKAVDIMEITWPKLRKYLDKVLQEYIKTKGEQYVWDHLGWTTAAGMEDALKEITKNWNKYVKAVQKSGDIVLGILGLHEHSFYYDLSLKFDEHGAADVETQTFTVNGVSFTMVGVEGGTFMMGAADDDSEAYSGERPRHQVTLSSFAIGQTEVTQELWQAVMGSNPSYFNGGSYGTNLRRPVEEVSWNDCQDFFVKLNAITGKKFRLPTEAEWEFAARGGNNSRGYKYSGSNTLGDVAWYDGNSNSVTHESGTKTPNELGLYDMSGNVWEWCQDWYGDYSSIAQTNPTGPSSGSYRVGRGGGWGGSSGRCRVSDRSDGAPGDRSINLGLRLAL